MPALKTSTLLLSTSSLVLTLSSLARAQGAEPPGAGQAPPENGVIAPPPPAPAPPPAVQASPPPAMMAPPPASPDAGKTSDHEAVVGRFAIGYLGRRSLSIATGISNNEPITVSSEEVNAPVLGIRYWLQDMVGIDAGVGFLFSGGSTDVKGTGAGDGSRDEKGYTAMIFHGGVPLSLASVGHFSFQVVPEANVGFASSKLDQGTNPDLKLKGFHLDVGARAGAEIHFGFIGIPELSLQGSVGARFAYDKITAEVGDASVKTKNHSFGTTVGDNPWNIFTSNVAALYYF